MLVDCVSHLHQLTFAMVPYNGGLSNFPRAGQKELCSVWEMSFAGNADRSRAIGKIKKQEQEQQEPSY